MWRLRGDTGLDAQRDAHQPMTPRSASGWLALICRLLAAVGFLIALLDESGPRLALVAVALALLLISLVVRRKAASAEGAVWSASADLIEGRKQTPGQLSFTPDAVIWIPSSYSVRHGFQVSNIPLTPTTKVTLSEGPGLLDVFVDAHGPGRQVRFLTHRSRGLQRAVRQLTNGAGQ
jgi:hypothetical protein